YRTAEIWHDLRRNLLAVFTRLCLATAEDLITCLRVTLNKLPDLIDDRDGVQIALALRIAPRKQSVSAQHNSVATRRVGNNLPQHHAKLKARPLPRQPCQLVPKLLVELLHLLLTIGRRRQRDAPVRVQMVDMWKRQITMQRRVDRSCHWVVPERTQRIRVHHL